MKTETLLNAEICLPNIEVKGEVIASNFSEIREAIRNGLKNIEIEPKTDEDFGQAKLDLTNLKTVEDALSKAKVETLKQCAEIQNLFGEIDELSDELREARLKLEKAVKTQTDKIKNEIFSEAMGNVIAVMSEHFRKRIEEAMKNKRTLASLKEAAEREVVIINAETKKNREIILAYEKHQGKSMVLDSNKLELMNEEALRVELESRVQRLKAEAETKKAREEAVLAKKEAEQAKAEAAEARKEAPSVPTENLPLASQPTIEGEIVRNVFDKRGEVKEEAEIIETPINEDEEWSVFRMIALEAFQPLKKAREALTSERNKHKAALFSNAVNEGWKGANS